MKKLWAPWRARYILGSKEKGCLLCRVSQENKDGDNLVVWRGERGYVMLNLYPYNTGHLLIVPYRHERLLENLSDGESLELMQLAQMSIRALKKSLRPQGFNLGVNLGSVAGAGIEDHVHVHIVPRWGGDTNFMPVFTATKVISQALKDTFDSLKAAFDAPSSEDR
jgi:ATP adenylyltransferase